MRLCDMMHLTSPDSVKNHILEQFSDGDGHLRVLFATIAYGMGVNCKNVRRVIHFGPSKSIESYMQESGRCGRDRDHSIAILLFNGITIHATDSDMKDYIHSTSCRCQFLLQHFSKHAEREMPKGHMCCDNCGKTCVCNNGYCNVNLYLPFSTREDVPQKTRPVADEQKKELRVHLNILMKKHENNNRSKYKGCSCFIPKQSLGVWNETNRYYNISMHSMHISFLVLKM